MARLDQYQVNYDDHGHLICNSTNLRHLRVDVGDNVLVSKRSKTFVKAVVTRVVLSDRRFEVWLNGTRKRAVEIHNIEEIALSDEIVHAKDAKLAINTLGLVINEKVSPSSSPLGSSTSSKYKGKDGALIPASRVPFSKRQLRSESTAPAGQQQIEMNVGNVPSHFGNVTKNCIESF